MRYTYTQVNSKIGIWASVKAAWAEVTCL